MIGKGKAIAHTANSVDYAVNKKGAEILATSNLSGRTGQEIAKEMRVFHNLNTRATNKSLSFVLSPEPKDGKKMTNEDHRKVAGEFLVKMGLAKNQSILVKHTDKGHTHLHIITNRINSEGKAYNDSKIGKKAQRIADEVAKQNNLTRAKVVEELKKENTKDLRAEIHRRHKIALSHRPKDFKDYTDLMKGNGVEVKPSINKQKELQGFRLEMDGHSFKASEIHRSMTLSRLSRDKNFEGHNPEFKQSPERNKNRGFSR